MTLLAVAVGGRGPVDPDEPVLHADDDALLRGRAAFETVRVYGGRPFRLDRHLERMAASAARLGIAWPGGLEELVAEALGAAGVPDAALRLYVTPGREGREEPVSLALVAPLPPGLEEERERGIALVALPLGLDPDLYDAAPWLLGGVKSTSYAVNMAAAAEARRRGADDAVFLGRDGIVLEGPTTNVWWRRGRVLRTPALSLGILAGVTREALVGLAGGLGYAVRESAWPLEELAGAEEAFTSSSVREVMPVARLDGRPLGRGPAALELQRALRAAATR